jgi:CHAD domain-containing protein
MPNASTQGATLLSTALRKNAAALTRAARRAERGEVSGIHRLRVATRRLRQALKGFPDHESSERDLRRLTKGLGPVRELDVARKVLAASASRESWPAAAVLRVDEYLAARREKEFKDTARILEDFDAKALAKKLIDISKSIDAESVAAQAAPLHDAARALVRSIDAAGTLYAPTALHDIRIAAKKLRYGVELAGEPAPGTLRRLRAIQTLLGSMHDLQILQQLVQEVATDPRDLGEMATLTSIARSIEGTCRAWHARALRSLPVIRTLAADLAAGDARSQRFAKAARMAGAPREDRAKRRRTA